jgi:hypothetical protein
MNNEQVNCLCVMAEVFAEPKQNSSIFNHMEFFQRTLMDLVNFTTILRRASDSK